MELSLHPAKRARRAYLSEDGPHLESVPSEEEKLLQLVCKKEASSDDPTKAILSAHDRMRDVVQATAELNQWINALELIRGKEYLKLLPIRRDSIGMKSTPLQDKQKMALVHQRLQMAADVLSQGMNQSQNVVERRRLWCGKLQTLQGNWVFSSTTDPNTRHTSLSIDCSFARFTRRPLVNLTRQPLDHLIPLEIASEGEDAVCIPSSIMKKEYLNVRLQIINSMTLNPIISMDSLDICRHNYAENSIEYFAFLNHHSHLSQQVFHFLSQGVKQCAHRVAVSFLNGSETIPPSQDGRQSDDTFLNSFTFTAKEKSRLILEISLNYSLLIELTPIRRNSSFDSQDSTDDSRLSPYLQEPYERILRSIFLSVVNHIPSQDVKAPLNAAEKYREAFIDAADPSISHGDMYTSLVRSVVRMSRIALCLAHTEALLNELAIHDTSIQRPYLQCDVWNQLSPAQEASIDAMVVARQSDRFVLTTDGSEVRVAQLTDDQPMGRYCLRDTRCLAELFRSELCNST